jgi:hypothetical protein
LDYDEYQKAKEDKENPEGVEKMEESAIKKKATDASAKTSSST